MDFESALGPLSSHQAALRLRFQLIVHTALLSLLDTSPS